MNTENEGTDPSIDVFVLSGEAPAAALIGKQLSPHGYRVTLFSDSGQLIDAIHLAKPNLLICDATLTEPDGYGCCRAIKESDDLWMIPVLLVTSVSGLSDLLKVLDSNAENFIVRPYEAETLVTLVESMIAEGVERPDPDKIKTKFRIRHDDRDYEIVADRRRLLEFLLTSFEVAVDRADGLGRVSEKFTQLQKELESRVTNRTQSLSAEVERLGGNVKEFTRKVAQQERSIADLEGTIKELRAQLQQHEGTIAEKTEQLAQVTGELGRAKEENTEAIAQVRALTDKMAEEAQKSQGENESLRAACERIGDELGSTKAALADALGRISDHEVRHADLTSIKEKHEQSLQDRSQEIANLKNALSTQEARTTVAEEKVRELAGEKEESERALTAQLTTLSAKVDQLGYELDDRKRALEEENRQRIAVEKEFEKFSVKKEKEEAALLAESSSLREQRDTVQERFNSVSEQLGAEKQKNATLSANAQATSEELTTLREKFEVTMRRLEIANTAAEEEKQMRMLSERNTKEILAAKGLAVESHDKILSSLHDEMKERARELAAVTKELGTAKDACKKLENDLAAALKERDESGRSVDSLSKMIEELRASLEAEKSARKVLDETIREASREKENLGGRLKAIEREKAEQVEAGANRLRDLAAELERERSGRKSLERQLSEAENAQANREATRDEELRASTMAWEEARKALAEEKKRREAAEIELTQVLAARASEKIQSEPPATIYLGNEIARAVSIREPDQLRVVEDIPHAITIVDPTPLPANVVTAPAVQPKMPAPSAAEKVALVDVPEPDIQSIEDLFEDDPGIAMHEPEPAIEAAPAAGNESTGISSVADAEPEIASATAEQVIQADPAPSIPEGELAGEEIPGQPEEEKETVEQTGTAGTGPVPDYGIPPLGGSPQFDRKQWFEMMKWGRSNPNLSRDDRLRIIRLGRLIQKGRRLSPKQEEQVSELIVLAHSMGYRPK